MKSYGRSNIYNDNYLHSRLTFLSSNETNRSTVLLFSMTLPIGSTGVSIFKSVTFLIKTFTNKPR